MKYSSLRVPLALSALLAVIAAAVFLLPRQTERRRDVSSPATDSAAHAKPEEARPTKAVAADATLPKAAPAGAESTPVPLFKAPGASIGSRLDPKGAAYMQARLDGREVKGRMAPLELRSFAGLAAVQTGEAVRLPLMMGMRLKGWCIMR
jgi:hypothetical protein